VVKVTLLVTKVTLFQKRVTRKKPPNGITIKHLLIIVTKVTKVTVKN